MGDIKVSPEKRIIVEDPTYMENMAQVIAGTDSYVIVNYIGWRVSLQCLKRLNKEARRLINKFYKASVGSYQKQPRHKQCAKEIGFNVPLT